MWNFLIQVAIMFALALLLQPKMKFPKKKPLGEDDFEIPTAEEGRPLTVIFGKRRYGGPNVVWWGDLGIVALRQRVKTGLFSHKHITVGYLYYLGIHFILGYSRVDGIKQIIVGEKPVWPTLNNNESEAVDGLTSATIEASDIFGGNEKEGGISGIVDFEYGDVTQGQNSYLVSKLGTNVPAFRGQTGIVLRKVYVGTSGYIKPWSFLWKRVNRLVSGEVQWYIAKANIGNDSLNAIHVIREILTDVEFGLGYNILDIDNINFQSCADICYIEGLGISFNWDASTPCEDVIQKILDIIDGALFQNQSTGEFQITLARENYTPATLEIFNDSHIVDIEEYSRPGFGEISSRITVNWTEIYYDETRPAQAEDPAIMKKQGGGIIESTFDYQMIVDGNLAGRIANRELKQATSMLAVMKLKCLKTMAHIEPYSVFKISWTKLGLTEVIVRVVAIDYGNSEDDYITMDVIEDVFGLAYNVYDTPPATLWTSPINNPVDPTYKKLIESPYFILNSQAGGSSLIESLDNDAAFLIANAVAPSSDCLGCEILVEDYTGSGYVDEGLGVFVPSATLLNALSQGGIQVNNIDIRNVSDLESVNVGDYALIDDELIVIEGIGTNQISIGRGILDSLPASHIAGSRVWFIGSSLNFIDREYTLGDTPRVKFLTRTGNGVLDDAAYIEASAFNSRMIRPYCPARLQIDSKFFPTHFAGQPSLSWKHRDRTNAIQLSTIVRYDNTNNYGPETGTTYTLYIYDEDNNLVRTESGLTGTTYDYSEVNERSDCSLGPLDPLNSKLRFVLKAIRGSYSSFYQYDITVQRSSQGIISATAIITGTLGV